MHDRCVNDFNGLLMRTFAVLLTPSGTITELLNIAHHVPACAVYGCCEACSELKLHRNIGYENSRHDSSSLIGGQPRQKPGNCACVLQHLPMWRVATLGGRQTRASTSRRTIEVALGFERKTNLRSRRSPVIGCLDILRISLQRLIRVFEAKDY